MLKIYYTDVKLRSGQNQPDLTKLSPLGFDSLDVALEKAFVIIAKNAIVWKIEGPSEFQMDRTAVEKAYKEKTGKRPKN